MKTAAVLTAIVGSAAAFAPAPMSKVSTARSADMSKSLPFLVNPTNTAGYVGDVGFDPIGFSDMFDMKWLREAEIKHGRVAMNAALGFVLQEFITIPGYEHVDDSNMGPTVVGASAMLQIVAGVGFLEWKTNNGNITMETMFANQDREPGDLGWDPRGYQAKSTPEEWERLKLQELKNGRLAMLAIGGMIHHNWITGEALL